MNLDDYQDEAVKSVALPKSDPLAVAHRSLGLTGEAGILANVVKKVIRDKNGQPDKDDLKEIEKRLGDSLYYVAILAEYYDLKLSDVAAKNLEQSKKFRESREKNG